MWGGVRGGEGTCAGGGGEAEEGAGAGGRAEAERAQTVTARVRWTGAADAEGDTK